jgi:hypothetical protein
MPPKGAKKEKVEKAEKKSVTKKVSLNKDGTPKAKRAPSSFIIFSQEKRAEIKISHPEATFGEIGKILGALWKELDDESKAVRYL